MKDHIKLGAVFKLVGGGTPSTKNNKYWGQGTPWFSSADIDASGKINHRREVTPLGGSCSTTNIVPGGTVVVVTRVGLGKVAMLPFDMCFSQDIQALLPRNDTETYNPVYLMYHLSYIMYRMKYYGQGTTISGITKNQLSNVDIYWPHITIQNQIVAKIEELFSQLDSSVETLKKAKRQLAVYRQAVLKEAFDLATQSDSDSTAQFLPIEQLLTTDRKGMSTGPFGTMIKKQDHRSSGVPMLGIENIGKGTFVDGNKIFVTYEKAQELSSFSVLEGDIIISRSGTVGEICAVPKRAEGALLSTNLMRISLDKKKIRSDYFIYLFQSKGIVLDQIKELCKGSTRIFINQTILKQVMFPVPTLERQRMIVERIESNLSVCDSIEQTIDTALQQAEALRQSILKKAFEGSL